MPRFGPRSSARNPLPWSATRSGRQRWHPRLPRTWPSLLLLLLALLLLGSGVGAATFFTRGAAAQTILPYAMPGALRHALPTISVGPGTPTPDVYCCADPFTPSPQPTHPPTPTPTATPTSAQATPTAAPVALQVTLAPTRAQCDASSAPLPPVTLTLDNSQSGMAVSWALTLGPGPSGTGKWARATPSTRGTLPAGAAPQIITLTPDPTLCGQLLARGQPGHFTARVTTTPGGQITTATFTVTPFSAGSGSTPTPTITPAPPAASPTPSPPQGA